MALQVDHIWGGGNQERKRLGPDGLFKYILSLAVEDARKKYQVLCANCNVIKREENFEYASRFVESDIQPILAEKIGKIA